MNKNNSNEPPIQVHIGLAIKQELKRQRRSASWLADNLFCDRTNIYKLFDKASINTDLLYRISIILNHDFFNDISKQYKSSSECSQNSD